MMKATQKLHDMGQSIWLDNITRTLLTSGTLQRYIQEFAVTRLTSNPTIFDHAIRNSSDYDDAIRQKVQEGKSRETVFFELALPVQARGCDQMLTEFFRAGIDIDVLAARLQDEGTKAFVKSWSGLMNCIASRSKKLDSVQMS